MAIMLDKKSKPCHPINLHFKMDPEPESVLSALFNGAGAGDGQSDIAKLSLVTYSIYTNKHFWESAHSYGILHRHAAVHTYIMQVLTLRQTHTRDYTLTYRQTHTIETAVVWVFFRVTVTNKSSVVSGKVPPSSLSKRIVQMVGFSLSSTFLPAFSLIIFI